MQTDDLGGFAGWAVDVMEAVGAPGVGLVIAVENLFPPIPSEIILPLAGFTASRGDLTLAAGGRAEDGWDLDRGHESGPG